MPGYIRMRYDGQQGFRDFENLTVFRHLVNQLEFSDVTELAADGDELLEIYSQFGKGSFSSLPFPHFTPKGKVRWFGDMAKFIFFNLQGG